MNSMYNADRLNMVKRYNLAYEIILALGTSTAIAGWSILQAPGGRLIWGLLSGLVTILFILKPILRIQEQIERYSKLYAGYISLYFDLDILKDEIKRLREVTPEIRNAFQTAQRRHRELVLEDDPNPSEKVRRHYENKVNKEIPVSILWNPNVRSTQKKEISNE